MAQEHQIFSAFHSIAHDSAKGSLETGMTPKFHCQPVVLTVKFRDHACLGTKTLFVALAIIYLGDRDRPGEDPEGPLAGNRADMFLSAIRPFDPHRSAAI